MKKKTLIFSLVLCIMVISVFLITNYDNRSYKKDEKNEATYKTELALILIDGYGDEATETTLNEVPDASTHYLDFAKSYCENGSIIGWDSVNNKVKITASKADKCKLYYREGTAVNAKEDILAKNTLVTTTPDFSVAATEENTNIYQANDDFGTSYYFRGDTSNNYVKFGTWQEKSDKVKYAAVGPWEEYDTLEECEQSEYHTDYDCECVKIGHDVGDDMYWRIIRVNGDGTIRVIYDGISLTANGGHNHTATITGGIPDLSTLSYNNDAEEIFHVGYMYNNGSEMADSSIKKYVDEWYQNNINSTYGKYVSDGIFCNELEITSHTYYNSNGITDESSATYSYSNYAPYDRLEKNYSPKLTCEKTKDSFTVSKNKGNGLLKYPVGLLTADEAYFAGGKQANNSMFYLNIGYFQWTMTPNQFYINPSENRTSAAVFIVSSDGVVAGLNVDGPAATRPVINLNADLLFTGSGTIDNPYVVAGFEE